MQPKAPRCTTDITVRFSDLDAMGHVNNARYLTFFEEGRAAWFRDVLGMAPGSTDYPVIVARIEIDYLAPIPLGVVLRVGTQCTRLGSASLDVQGSIAIIDGDVAARYKAVLVWYDYASKTARNLPDQARAIITAYEGL